MKKETTLDFPHFGKRLYEIRKRLGLKQHELSQKINISKATISAWENNKSNAAMKNIESVAETLGVTFEEMTQEQPLQMAKAQHTAEEPIVNYKTTQEKINHTDQDLLRQIEHQWKTIHAQNQTIEDQNKIIFELVKKVK